MIEETAPIPHDDFAKVALPVQHIDFLGFEPDAIALIWIDLSERPDLVQMAQWHLGEQGIASCSWHASILSPRDAHIYFRLQARTSIQSVLILGFNLVNNHMQLSRIARDRFLWVMGEPRPDYLVDEYAAHPADLSERLRSARGEGITLGLHSLLAQELEALLLTWRQMQAQNN